MRKNLDFGPTSRGSRLASVAVMIALGAARLSGLGVAEQALGAPLQSSASSEKLPDWRGLWEPIFDRKTPRGAPLPLTPEYAEKLRIYKSHNQEALQVNCLPPGMPTVMTQPYPLEFLFTPGKVTVAIEAYSQMRRIYTDGRPHPADPDPLYNGHSIGHWEGDTLLVDTVGFVTDTRLNFDGSQHSDQMHIKEWMHLVGPDRLEIKTVIEDPKALTVPTTIVTTYGRHRDWNLNEYVCEQNNRNSVDPQGHPAINLAPPSSSP